ncbi:MAG: hypothetical protein RMK84_12500 [Oscillochloridaceae bacterium]|nr:hypothetical protein [Chloroflexaceae bacterium]MDW8390939.1 hypothetical protein [Oscillochloridaceae bacterium]
MARPDPRVSGAADADERPMIGSALLPRRTGCFTDASPEIAMPARECLRIMRYPTGLMLKIFQKFFKHLSSNG